VLVIGGAPQAEEKTADPAEIAAYISRLMEGGMKHKAAAKEAARVYDIPVSEAYEIGLSVKGQKDE